MLWSPAQIVISDNLFCEHWHIKLLPVTIYAGQQFMPQQGPPLDRSGSSLPPSSCSGEELENKIVAASGGMHVSPAKHTLCDYQESVADGQTDHGQSDTYASPCFAGGTIN